MRYIFLEAGDVKELTRQVQELIGQGREPQGGVSAASNQTMVWWYYQAMVRREP